MTLSIMTLNITTGKCDTHNDGISLIIFLLRMMTRHNDTRYNDTRYNDTRYDDSRYNDIRHNDTKHNETQRNDTQHYIRPK